MIDKRKSDLIESTFQNSFDKEKFHLFVKDLLNQFDDSRDYHFEYAGAYIPDAFREHILRYERLGKYIDPEDKCIDILIVYLKKERALETARSMQRRFIAQYLNGSRGGQLKDAALVAFVSPSAEDWRFSLVKMEYTLTESETGSVKFKEEFTPARRWSFLVGIHENSHTAQSRLAPIMADDDHNPTLSRLEEAFNIEKVTREFFEKYRDLFIRAKQALDQIITHNPVIEADFEKKNINSVDFAKKLLGQIIFLYFLQKKGWFGVGRDDVWGSGSRHFLRELFDKKHGDYRNFFNEILEPLFYEALRSDRSSDDHYYSRFNCKIPFLNGGLFDPLNEYDWVHLDILLPNDLFSNAHKTKEGDVGDGILDVFDRYNFTVKEDEPLEKEVAIDPELLGKAYEKFNAIRPDNFEDYLRALKSGKKGEETKFNKQFGVYYTPREIVHYMCQQSLICYLSTQFEGIIAKEDFEMLILHADKVLENETRVSQHGRETEKYAFKIPQSIRENALKIDEKLAEITVCDPAVGSGAFPVGMMNEIIKIRCILSIFYQKINISAYEYKRHAIQHSLYGVDIDPGAVEIAKLRLWLSLVVEEENVENIKPLPNLDYKIVCGDSLFEVEKNIFNQQLFNELELQKLKLFAETNPSKKFQIKISIDQLINLITSGFKEFDFKVYFSEIFHKKNGFDIVIANPPYLESRHPNFKIEYKRKLQLNLQKIYGKNFSSITVGADLLIYFYELSIRLINKSGIITFITQNSWLDTNYGNKFKEFLLRKVDIICVIDSDFKYFQSQEGPNINTVITIFQGKQKISNDIVFAKAHMSFDIYPLSIYSIEKIPKNIVSYKKINNSDHLLKKYKLGFLFLADQVIIDVLSKMNNLGKKLSEIKDCKITIGQGLNLLGDYIVNIDLVNELGIEKVSLIPIYTKNEVNSFIWKKSSSYLINENNISNSVKKSMLSKGIKLFDLSTTTKDTPVMIMPRGIGQKHFCVINEIEGFSSSCLDIYCATPEKAQEIIQNIWIFLNSSLFWLIREFSGRKNLGGGLLKSEATDLKEFPMFFNFGNRHKVEECIFKLSNKKILPLQEEIFTKEHNEIDKIVYDFLGLPGEVRDHIGKLLISTYLLRMKKSKT